ncbi:Alpha-actinin-like protein 1 [Talaromyces islandicus]|uniref:Alpha-actinin-like protein 1 n=1 Tax=Talaromyces islandicus TaxID=28573 RepID=A0A0U1LV11_TALIS|nr:Alpha-actinin-like protein 1 [Talaromyces islandicus]
MLMVEKQWINTQQKTFTKWLNNKIKARDLAIEDLVKDLSDGVVLIHLLEILGDESLGRYASKPKLRVQKFENVNKSLDFIKWRGIPMTNIGAEDIVDGNRKIILGLIWTLISKFTISDINQEGISAKEGLLLWCQRKTACYPEVEVRDFSTSWNDGLAFCALLDIHRPDLIDYDALDKNDHRGNMQLAFDIAANEIGIPDLLDVEDVCDVAKPDERSLMTYMAYWFHAFSQLEKVENAGRRVEKFVSNMQGAWEMQTGYEKRMKELLRQIAQQRTDWQEASFEGTYADAKEQLAQFSQYKRNQKRKWVAEKSDLAALLGNIKTKLSTYRLRPYEPPVGLRLDKCDQEWESLMKDEHERSQLINEAIRDIKNKLRRSFADKANDFALTLKTLTLAISGLEGEVDDQLAHVQRLSDNLPPLDAYLETIADLEEQCAEANIDENDYTMYTLDELAYELGLVKSSVAKKLAFLENQMVARNMTNLTPIQLEEFESVFRHFDRDGSNTLQEIEFSAALASLGLVYDEDEMHEVFLETCGRTSSVSFEQFIRFMVSVTEDQNSAEQVFQSFREVADGKPYVTELDLRHSLIPDDLIENLLGSMPKHEGPDLLEDRDVPKYDYITFMEKMMDGQGTPSDDHKLSPTALTTAMDRSLDEIISERPQKQGGRRERRNRNTSNAPRDGVKKSYRERVDLDRDWVHDRFQDEGDSRAHRRNDRSRRDRSPDADQPARLRVDNLHYDLTEEDLEGLFSGIGPISRVRIEYDRAGRSEGVAIVTYHHIEDAKLAIREFDGANARGQPIRLTLLRGGGASRAEKGKSLFERIERPGDRSERSLSPASDGGAGGRRRRRGGRGQHRSDVSKPAPDHIDRYVPGQRSPVRRNGGGGRRPGERRDEKRRDGAGGGGGRAAGSGPRPKKTQEELDQEMDDYWSATNNTGAATETVAAPATETVAAESAPTAAATAADDDIDMIE